MRETYRLARYSLSVLLRLVVVIVRWPLALVAMLALASLLIVQLGAWLELVAPGGRWLAAAEVSARVLIALPFAGIAVLLLHPLRGPLMLAALPWRLVYLLRRRLFPRRQLAASPTAPAPASPTPQRSYRPLSRRRFLAESAAVGAILVDGLLYEPSAVEFTSIDISIPDLPERFAGFTIAQLSDLHMGPFSTLDDLARLVPRVNALNADMITVTGDFVDFEWRYAAPAAEILRGLRAPEGVYSVLGNHDHYAGVERVSAAIARGDLGLLVNRHTVLRRGADKLYLAGVDDATPSHRYSRGPFADLPRALRGMRDDAPRLLLLHNPVLAPQVVEAGLDLALCGHTHAGQFRVPYLTGALVRKIEYIDWGHYQWGSAQFYVNRGFGTVGPPLRFRARPEVTLVRLV